MEIHLSTDDSIRLTAGSEGFSFEPGEASSLSPFHLLAASLATCTHSVLHGYAHQAGLPLDGLSIHVSWELGGDPYRVTRTEMTLDWPGLPASRREAARRVASHCTIHATLEHGGEVETWIGEDEVGLDEGGAGGAGEARG